METDKTDKRGGPRPNSGRRPIDPALKRKPFSCTLAPETDEWIRDMWAKSPRHSLGEVIDAIVVVHTQATFVVERAGGPQVWNRGEEPKA